jgi:alpha-beta hydrolase superfamily lysophospholipase
MKIPSDRSPARWHALLCTLALALVAPLVLADDARWPARVVPPDQDTSRGIIVPIPEAKHGLEPIRPMGVARPATSSERAAAKQLLGQGDARQVRFEGPGSFLYRPYAEPQRRRGRARPPEPDHYFKFISGRDNGDAVDVTRTWFAWYPARREPIGVVLIMPGMLGTPEVLIEHFIERLAAEGYGILRMMCQPSRFTESISFDVDLKDPTPVVQKIAAEVSERLAECAYAVEAAFAHIESVRPQYADFPRIAIGMSGGAMILPTVVAREVDRYSGALLIAGGANVMAILEDSNYRQMINAAQINWLPEQPTPEQRKDIDALYLSFATLDPYHTAPQIAGVPILMIHGDQDLAVPAPLGDLLWEKLQQPERWIEDGGHEVLFMRLPPQMDRIITWLRENAHP